LKFFAVDGKGNEEAVNTENYIIDLDPPVTTASPGGGSYGAIQNVTLTASEPATIYYSLDGADPLVGGVNTTSGPSPLTDIVIDGTTLKFFAVDSVGHTESIKTEEYDIDVTAPNISFIPPAPEPFGVLTATPISWQSDKPVDYIIELGGDGTAGSGEELAFGSVAADTIVTQEVLGVQLSFDAATPFWVYVTDQVGHSSSISLDLSMKSTESIPIGNAIAWDIKILPNGRKAYASISTGFENNDHIAVIGTDPTRPYYSSIIKTIPVPNGDQPFSIAITPDGTRVYITTQRGDFFGLDSILLISTSTDNVTDVLSLVSPYTYAVTGISITPDGKRGYFVKGSLEVLDTNPSSIKYNQIIDHIITQSGSFGNISTTPDGTKAIANRSNLHMVEVIDIKPGSPNYNKIIATPVSLTAGGHGTIAMSPDSKFTFVTSDCVDCIPRCSLCKIDLESFEVVENFSDTDFLNPDDRGNIVITPDGQSILYVDGNHSKLYVINAVDLSLIGGIELGAPLGGGIGFDITPDGTKAYIMRDFYTEGSDIVMVPLL
jgi:DNA-binding beta-propeller fold protein YncE